MRICNVFAIPREKVINFVDGCNGYVDCIISRFCRDDLAAYEILCDGHDLLRKLKEWHRIEKS